MSGAGHKEKFLAPSLWASLKPFGVGELKTNNFQAITDAVAENKDNLAYAWRILAHGVCDGCALGSTGMKDWTLNQVHLCNVRLRLLRLNTAPAMDGLHASGLFSADGELVALREDVGRHNAMDKLVGWAFLNGKLPLEGHVLLVSGRSSFELVQKSLSAGVAALCSVSAPSSLGVDLAREFGLTLVGFLREGRFKLYSGAERARLPQAPA